jgi:hypothetical protein
VLMAKNNTRRTVQYLAIVFKLPIVEYLVYETA